MHEMMSLMGQLTNPGLCNGLPSAHSYGRSPKQLAHLKNNHKLQFERGLNKYRSLLQGRDWLTTQQLENIVGANASGPNAFLRKLKRLGYMENRPRGGTEKYYKNRGWDWRWITGK